MKTPAFLLGFAVFTGSLAAYAQQQVATDVLYRFHKGETTKHQMVITTDTNTEKDAGAAPAVGKIRQNTRQDMVIEQKILEVDESGTAEVQLTFRSAKTDVKISSGAEREPKPPDTLQYLKGKSLKAYITSDGQVFAVEQVASIINAAREAAKDPALMELINQSLSEDYFKALIQNLYPRLPLRTNETDKGWDIISDVFLARTAFKLRITRKFTLTPPESGMSHLNVRGEIKAVPVDPATPPNPASPFVEVLMSTITGDAELALDKGAVVSSNAVQRIKMRNSMRVRQQRGGQYRTEVVTDSTTSTSVKLLK